MTEDTPTKIMVNCTTGETEVLPLTEEEIAEGERIRSAFLTELTARNEEKAVLDALKASAKLKLIAGEPLTAEEADTLVL